MKIKLRKNGEVKRAVKEKKGEKDPKIHGTAR